MSGIGPGACSTMTRASVTGPSGPVTLPEMTGGIPASTRPRSRRNWPGPPGSGLPGHHAVVHRSDDPGTGVGRRAAVRVDGERIPLAVDDPVDRAAALATEGVDVVEDLAGPHRGDLASGVPLGAVGL